MASHEFAPGRWIADQRQGEGRGVRVSSHVEGGFLVLSTWKEGVVVATARLLPDEAATLVAGVADGLSRLATSKARTALDAPAQLAPSASEG